MIVFGSKATSIGGATLHINCPHCQKNGSVQMGFYQKYAHLYWIPTFPMRKLAFTHCSHCNQTLEEAQFTDEFFQITRILKPQAKTPIWTWSGLAIIIGGLLWVSIMG